MRTTQLRQLITKVDNTLVDGNFSYSCSSGKGGRVPANQKKEGDGASPIGNWRLKHVYFRADRMAEPATVLPVTAIKPNDGWCDDPADRNYNKLIERPYPASHEKMWRDDYVYDVVIEITHNDNPPISGLGSAIFMHIAKPDYQPTEGCIALTLDDLLSVLSRADANTFLTIEG
ncbi:MAG: L,D-transpeptidase family protein [Pseudomonadota bacterium]